MAFTPKVWQNSPSTATPLSAAALIDLETRLSNLAFGGTTVRTTASYTAVPGDVVQANPATGGITVTLPLVTQSTTVTVFAGPNITTGNTVTVQVGDAAKIFGAGLSSSGVTSVSFGSYGQTAILITDGFNWYLIGAGGSHSQSFTASGTWTVPTGVTSVHIRATGGGGGGAGGNSVAANTGAAAGAGGGGGGAAGLLVDQTFAQGNPLAVNPGDLITITIGAGGAGGPGCPAGSTNQSSAAGSNGGFTTVVNTTTGLTLMKAWGGIGGFTSFFGTITPAVLGAAFTGVYNGGGAYYGANGSNTAAGGYNFFSDTAFFGSIAQTLGVLMPAGSGGAVNANSAEAYHAVVGGAGGGGGPGNSATSMGNAGNSQQAGATLTWQSGGGQISPVAKGADAQAATSPGCGGGGGGGSCNGAVGGAGGSGAPGKVTIWW